jgi:hypothetical protein
MLAVDSSGETSSSEGSVGGWVTLPIVLAFGVLAFAAGGVV